jgi:prepilin-type N-terminal cleavage/methylation domain-containing protein
MKKAFTMLELVFVIVVVGILSYFAASSFQRNPLREAADQLVSHIRYTQHLAMIDDKFDPNDSTWYRERWQVVFNSDDRTYNQWAYTIFSDGNKNANPNLTLNEVAINPLDNTKYLTGGYTGIIFSDGIGATQEMNLGMKYGVTNIIFSATCKFSGSQRISFDYLGRPLKGVPSGFTAVYQANRLITNDCNIALVGSDGNITITIKPETGYTYISSQNY